MNKKKENNPPVAKGTGNKKPVRVKLHLEKTPEDKYKTAIDFVSGYSNKINSIQNHLSYINNPTFQPSVINALTSFQKQFSVFKEYKSLLPTVDILQASSPFADITRNVTLGLSDLLKPRAIEAISKSFSVISPEISKKTIQGTIL